MYKIIPSMTDPAVTTALNTLASHIEALTRRVTLIEQVVESQNRSIQMIGNALETVNNRLNQIQWTNSSNPFPTTRMQM